MADVYQKIKMLSVFRLNPDRFLPVIDHAWKVFPAVDRGTDGMDDPEYNLGWDTGLLDAERPYFMEGWATNGITMLTYFVSTSGMEKAAADEVVIMLTEAGLFRFLNQEKKPVSVLKYEDDHGNEFFSVNVVAGKDDELFVSGGIMYPYAPLNEYNRRKFGKVEKDEQ